MVPLRVLQAEKPVVPVAVLNALAAALTRSVAKLAAATAVQAAADRQAAARVAAPAALDAEHVAAVPALQAAAGPVDAAAQTHKAVGTGVAATDEQPHALGVSRGMIHAVNTNLTNALIIFDILVIRIVVTF